MILSAESTRAIRARLEQANLAFAVRYPGDSGRRQPVHSFYGGAHLFHSGITRKLGDLALQALDEYAPDADTFAQAPLPASLAHRVYPRIVEKLRREPVEDFRIDFEDGYGNRRDAEEDGHAASAAMAVAAGPVSPFIGIRIKPFTEELRERSMRTLDIFLTTLLRESGGALPGNFVVTLPKITVVEQMSALADLFDLFEPQFGLAPGTLKLEFMVETTQSITMLPEILAAARGRCIAAHFGAYDYTASCGITAAHQHMRHPACDFARHAMQVALAGTGLWLSDGGTNILPTGDRATIYRAWKLHFDHIQHSLMNGFYQGWDLHPLQLPTRYAAVFAFFIENLDQAAGRLRNFVAKAAQSTLSGDVFDDAATGQGLLNYFLRAVNCGAISQEEACSLTGLAEEQLRSGSFASACIE